MRWNNDWPEPECCPMCSGVISSRRQRTCGRCGASLEAKNELGAERESAIRIEIDAIHVERMARRADERRKDKEDAIDFTPVIYFSF